MTETSESVPTQHWAQHVRDQLERVQATLPGLPDSVDVECPDRSAVADAALDLLTTAHTEISLAARRRAAARCAAPVAGRTHRRPGLNSRPYNILARHNARTIGDLVTLSEPHLTAMRRMEPANLAQVTRVLDHYNLALASDRPRPIPSRSSQAA